MNKCDVVVVGGGLMGKGIAQTFLEAKIPVTVVEINLNLHKKILEDIKNGISKKITKGLLAEYDLNFVEANLNITDDYKAIQEANFIIEAVPEIEKIKIETYNKISEYSDSNAILATNTSGLSVAKLSSGYLYQSQFIGMHFFYPVPLMNLVEVIPSVNTSQEVVLKVTEMCKALKKEYVIANDYPGFIVNRILIPMVNEAIYCVMEGESIEDVDTAMQNGANLKMGPLTLADFVGLDVLYATMEGLYEGFNDSKYRPAPLLKRMVESGMRGRKNNQGFYTYDENGNKNVNKNLRGK